MNPEFGVSRRGFGINIDLNYKFNYPGVPPGILGQPWRVAAIGEMVETGKLLKTLAVFSCPRSNGKCDQF